MNEKALIPEDFIITKIYFIRGEKVMLDRDLAELYDVETKNLKRQVRRNIDRFPEDFMFELTNDEFENLRCQIGTSSWGGSRYPPLAFTEQGVAQLSGVLKSDRAIKVREFVINNLPVMAKLFFLVRVLEKLSIVGLRFTFSSALRRKKNEPEWVGYLLQTP
ncbi:MAG TPA: ORF6N domain-containing protein [Bacteroidetes bacterium]|nr:ORF6N domain-containing protein [Bacteroidota bacterium]